MNGEFITDNLGWVDDFRALPGQCGQPLTQRIHVHALMTQGVDLGRLKQMGFSKEIVLEVFNQRASEEFDENR